MKGIGVPAKYLDATWDGVTVAQDAYEWLQDWPTMLKYGRGLLLAGPVGTGKSSLAALLAREVFDRGFTVGWEYLPTLLDDLQDRTTAKLAKARTRARQLLVIDDFGVTQLNDWDVPQLDKIVETRYGRRLPTIVTTNIDPAVIGQDQRLGRIADRWRETLRVLVIDGNSRRRPL